MRQEMTGFWDGSGISWTICKQSAPRSRQITTPTPHQSICTRWMLFLTPNQQCQSTQVPSIADRRQTGRESSVSFVRLVPCVRNLCLFGARCYTDVLSGTQTCRCIDSCAADDTVLPVCGSDSVTYESECHLRNASCVLQKPIAVRVFGSCGNSTMYPFIE